MPYKGSDKAKCDALKRSQEYRKRKHAERFGPNAGRMNGRHGNHARGEKNGRWSGDRRLTSEGYIAVRVPINHPHGWGSARLKNFRYAYEHVVVMMQIIGRPLTDSEIVHHNNGNRTDNRPENLKLLTATEHAKEHTSHSWVRDTIGRFNSLPRHKNGGGSMEEWPSDLRVRQFPEVRNA